MNLVYFVTGILSESHNLKEEKMKKAKRILSMFLAVMMIVMMIPFSVIATDIETLTSSEETENVENNTTTDNSDETTEGAFVAQVGEGKTYANLNDAIAAVPSNATSVTFEIYGAVVLETAWSHGDLLFAPTGVIANVVGKDATATVTITGGGVPDIVDVNMKDLTFKDEGEYLTTANEFMYQNFKGTCTFTNVTFEDGIRFGGETTNVKFVDCTFNANTNQEYAVWFDQGTYSIEGSTLTADGAAYGIVKSENAITLTVTETTFTFTEECTSGKPAFNLGVEATVTVKDNTFVGCDNGTMEIDSGSVNGNVISESQKVDEIIVAENTVKSAPAAGTITIGYTRGDGFWGEGGSNSKESFVVELYEGGNKIASATLNNINGIIDGELYVTWSIPFAGSNDEYWTVEWAEGYPKYDMYPDTVKLVADGALVATNEVRFNAPDELNKIVAFAEGSTGGVVAYTSLVDAIGSFDGRKVNILCDVTESITSMNGATLTTTVEGGVTITNTYDDYVYANDLSIGKGVTVKAGYFFYDKDGVNTVEGALEVQDTFYHGYDAITTVQNGGTIKVGGTTILRYNENDDAGIYIYGDNDSSTVEFDCDYYIGAYSGTFYAEDANIEVGYFLLKNSYDNSDYADIYMTLDNSTLTVVGTIDTQDSFIIDDQAHLTIKNGSSIADVRDFNILTGTNLEFNIDATSSIQATYMNIAEDVPFEAEKNEDGSYGIVAKEDPIASVNGTNYASLEDAIAALKANGGTLVLLSDINESITLNYPADGAEKELTIDLNGKTITSAESTLWVSDGYVVTVKDSSEAKTGKIISTNTNGEAIAITRGGQVILESGYVYNTAYAVYLYSGNATGEEKFVINGGTVEVPNGGIAIAVGSGTVIINGGKVLCNKTPGGEGWNTYVYEDGALEITGGEFLGTIGSNGTVAISGGTFSYCDDPNDGFNKNHLAPGYNIKKNADGKYVVYALPTELSGSGTAEDPYLIGSYDELVFFRNDVNNGNRYNGKFVKLTADIDLNDEEWTPIGDYKNDASSFLGTFDGDGHIISNLWISGYTKEGAGFFSNVGLQSENISGTVKNVTFNNVTIISSQSYVGVIAKAPSGAYIYNVKITGKVNIQGYGYVGGIAGHGYPKMDNCSVEAEGKIIANYRGAGAILGFSGDYGAKITNSSVSGVGEGLEIHGNYGGAAAIIGSPYGAALENVSASNLSITSNSDYCVGYLAGGGTVTNGTVSNVTATASGEPITAADVVAYVNDEIYFSLQEALDAAIVAGDTVTVVIANDVDLTGTTWNPVYFDSYKSNGANTLIIDGNGKTITGLSDMLFSGVWTGTKLEIKNLTIDKATIKHDVNDEENIGVGAIIGNVSAVKEFVLTNVKLTNSYVEGGHWTGGFVGYIAGYSGNDGPVFTTVTITGCTVEKCEIVSKGSVGGVVGHATGDSWTSFGIEESTITGNKITSTGSSTNKAGIVAGTIGAAGTASTTNGTTLTGGVSVSVTESGNKATSNGTVITTVYGRQGSETGKLEITGGTYENNPIEENVPYAAPAEGLEIKANEDGTYGVVEKIDEIFGKTFYIINMDTKVSNGKTYYGVGMFTGINSLKYKEVGFYVTVGGATKKIAVSKVYNSVTAGGNTITAENVAGTYIFGVNIWIPDADAEVTYQAYAIDLDGNEIKADKTVTTGNIYTK